MTGDWWQTRNEGELGDLRGSNIGCVVSGSQFRCKAFMEGESTGFGTRIIDIGRVNRITCHTCDRHHMTMVLLDHRRKKFSNHQEMRYRINIKCLSDLCFGAFQNRSEITKSSIIDNHSRISLTFPDFRSC